MYNQVCHLYCFYFNPLHVFNMFYSFTPVLFENLLNRTIYQNVSCCINDMPMNFRWLAIPAANVHSNILIGLPLLNVAFCSVQSVNHVGK